MLPPPPKTFIFVHACHRIAADPNRFTTKRPALVKERGLCCSTYARAVVRVLKPDPTFGLFNGKLF